MLQDDMLEIQSKESNEKFSVKFYRTVQLPYTQSMIIRNKSYFFNQEAINILYKIAKNYLIFQVIHSLPFNGILVDYKSMLL